MPLACRVQRLAGTCLVSVGIHRLRRRYCSTPTAFLQQSPGLARGTSAYPGITRKRKTNSIGVQPSCEHVVHGAHGAQRPWRCRLFRPYPGFASLCSANPGLCYRTPLALRSARLNRYSRGTYSNRLSAWLCGRCDCRAFGRFRRDARTGERDAHPTQCTPFAAVASQ